MTAEVVADAAPSVVPRRLQGRRAIVTGGARGIGAAIARRLLREGAEVVVADVRADRLAQTVAELSAFGPVDGRSVDLDVDEELARLFDEAGDVDVLVNNAAVAPPTPTPQLTRAAFDAVLQTNVLALLACSQAAIAGMRRRGRGSIVNIASVNAFRGQPDMAAYNASKAAVVSLTRTLAVELAPDVRVNAVCPGSVATQMWELQPAGVRESLEAKIPMGRFATVDEVAAAVAFLASDDAAYVTGHALVVDGGLTARM